MKILATKEGGKLLNKDLEKRQRVNDLLVVENESATVQLNMTADEASDFELMTEQHIDSDVMPDEVVSKLQTFLEEEGLFE